MAIPVIHHDDRLHGPTGDPFRELAQAQQTVLQQLQNVFTGDLGGIWVPAADIEETEDAWLIEAEIPGVKREDIDIEVHENELEISGEIKERERKGIIRRRTRRVGRFEYRVTLPTAIDQDSIEATLDEGVLTIRVPKPEGARRHRIEIGASSR
jgi:HSP20 family protein